MKRWILPTFALFAVLYATDAITQSSATFTSVYTLRGSAGQPAISTSYDKRDGLFFPTAGVGVSVDGIERLGLTTTAMTPTVPIMGPTGNALALGSAAGQGITFSTNNGTLRMTVPSDSAGLTFPTTAAISTNAYTLDDYREVAFTPVVRGQTVAGTNTYSTQTGTCTKVGRQVTCHIVVIMTSKDPTMAGSVKIIGMPYVPAPVPVVVQGTFVYWVAMATAWVTMSGSLVNGSSDLLLIGNKVASTNIVTVDSADITGTTQLLFSITFNTLT